MNNPDFSHHSAPQDEVNEEIRLTLDALLPHFDKAKGQWEIGGIITQNSPSGKKRRFSVRAPHAAGGMGIVFQGIDESSGQLVAIKTLHVSKIPTAQWQKNCIRLSREIHTHQNLHDSHFLPLLDHGEFRVNGESIPYFVTRFVHGRSLYDKILEWKTLPQIEVLRILAELAEALTRLHEMSPPTCHRDVKPQNVLMELGGDGTARCETILLVDLGLAKTPNSREAGTTGMVGSFPYCSHEQLVDASTAGPASDVYSLGCVAYHMLIGTTPFSHWLSAYTKEIPQSPHDRDNRIDRNLSNLVMRMLSHEVNDRPTARGVLHEIKALIANETPLENGAVPIGGWLRCPVEWNRQIDSSFNNEYQFPDTWVQLFERKSAGSVRRIGFLTFLRSIAKLRRSFGLVLSKLCDISSELLVSQEVGSTNRNVATPPLFVQQQAFTVTTICRCIREVVSRYAAETKDQLSVVNAVPEFKSKFDTAFSSVLALENSITELRPGTPPNEVIDMLYRLLQETLTELLSSQRSLVKLQLHVKDVFFSEMIEGF